MVLAAIVAQFITMFIDVQDGERYTVPIRITLEYTQTTLYGSSTNQNGWNLHPFGPFVLAGLFLMFGTANYHRAWWTKHGYNLTILLMLFFTTGGAVFRMLGAFISFSAFVLVCVAAYKHHKLRKAEKPGIIPETQLPTQEIAGEESHVEDTQAVPRRKSRKTRGVKSEAESLEVGDQSSAALPVNIEAGESSLLLEHLEAGEPPALPGLAAQAPAIPEHSPAIPEHSAAQAPTIPRPLAVEQSPLPVPLAIGQPPPIPGRSKAAQPPPLPGHSKGIQPPPLPGHSPAGQPPPLPGHSEAEHSQALGHHSIEDGITEAVSTIRNFSKAVISEEDEEVRRSRLSKRRRALLNQNANPESPKIDDSFFEEPQE